jgi:hypothetical protein
VSIKSPNVRHEATVAREQGKLVPVLLDPLRVEQFPMGLFNTQAARLYEWSGDGGDPEWKKLLAEIENKAMPAWAGRRMEYLAAEVRAESQRRETAEAKEDGVEAQLRQEMQKQRQLRGDRQQAQAETEAARAELAGVKEALDAAKLQNSDIVGRLAAAENLAASAGKRFPPWTLLVAVVLALGVGASVTYFQQKAVWTEREARAVSDAEKDGQKKIDAETAAKADAERRVAKLNTLLLTEKKRRIFNNTDLRGFYILQTPSTSVENCHASCLRDSKCNGFDLSPSGTCRTYSAITDQHTSSGWIAGRWD